jgi:hypothetical protein
MYLVELRYPGGWVKLPDNSVAFKAQSLLHSIEGELVSLALALDGFQSALTKNDDLIEAARAEMYRKREDLRRRAEGGVSDNAQDPEARAQRPPLDDLFRQRDPRVYLEAKLTEHRQRLAEGVEPQVYTHRRMFLYARTFLLTADLILSLLDKLSGIVGSPPELEAVIASLEGALPNLHKTRNSSAHIEQRLVGERQNGKAIDAKPYESLPFIKTAGGGMLIENLEGTWFGSTLENGDHGKINVVPETIDTLVAHVQQAINALQWTGHPSVYPS